MIDASGVPKPNVLENGEGVPNDGGAQHILMARDHGNVDFPTYLHELNPLHGFGPLSGSNKVWPNRKPVLAYELSDLVECSDRYTVNPRMYIISQLFKQFNR